MKIFAFMGCMTDKDGPNNYYIYRYLGNSTYEYMNASKEWVSTDDWENAIFQNPIDESLVLFSRKKARHLRLIYNRSLVLK